MFINNTHPRGNCNTYTELLKTTNAHASCRCERILPKSSLNSKLSTITYHLSPITYQLPSPPLLYSLQRLCCRFVAAESGQADVPFSARSEAGAWGANYMSTIKQLFEELP